MFQFNPSTSIFILFLNLVKILLKEFHINREYYYSNNAMISCCVSVNFVFKWIYSHIIFPSLLLFFWFTRCFLCVRSRENTGKKIKFFKGRINILYLGIWTRLRWVRDLVPICLKSVGTRFPLPSNFKDRCRWLDSMVESRVDIVWISKCWFTQLYMLVAVFNEKIFSS